MPFEITNHGDYLLFRLSGVVTAADLDRIATEVEVLEDSIPHDVDRITDITAVEHFDVHFPDVQMLADRRRGRQFSRPIRSAIIVSERVQLGLARMYQMLDDNPMSEIQIVYSLAEAMNWIAGKAAVEKV